MPSEHTLSRLTSAYPSSPIDKTFCPYLGLKSYENNELDANLFLGRESLTKTLLNKLQCHNFLAILGTSGSGKSSLLKAGLLHHLSCERAGEIKLIQPSQHPLQSLAMAFLNPTLPKLQKAEQITEIKTYLQQGSQGLSYILNIYTTSKVILAIDQFEELFTLCQHPEEISQFLTCLFDNLQQNPQKLSVIVAIDAYFLGHCLEQDPIELGQKIQESFVAITPLSNQQRYDVITLPAQKANLTLDSQLVEQLLKDTQGLKGNLPLLQYTLWQIWQQSSEGHLRLEIYQQLGNLRTILDRQANQIFQQLTRLQKKTAQQLFLSLIQPHEEMGDICYKVDQRELASLPDFSLVLEKFKQAGLIQTEERDAIARQETLIKLTHPIIIQHWSLLQKWLEQRRAFLRQQKNLESAAEQWETLNKDKAYLLTQDQLKIAQNLQSQKANVSPLAKEFMGQSVKKQSQKQFFTIILPIALLTFVGASAYRYWQIHQAWQTLDLVKTNPYDIRRHQALETLNFWKINLSNIPLASTNLSNVNLSKANLENMNFSGTNLENANLSQTRLVNANLANTNLVNTNLVKANLSQNDLSLTDLTQANLTEANLIQANLDFSSLKFANLSSASLAGSSLNFTDLKNVNLSKANLSNSNLSHANLTFSNLSFANLSNADLWAANLSKANLWYADLTNANLYNAYLINVQNLDPSHLKTACFWKYAYYKGKWNYQENKWEIDKIANQQFITKLKQDQTSDPQIQPICQRWQ